MKKTKKMRMTRQKTTLSVLVRNALSALCTQKWILPSIAGLAILVVAGVFLFSWITRPKNPGIAFYRVPEVIVKAITERAQDPEFPGEKVFTFITLDDSIPLEKQLDTHKKKISLLFAPTGQSAAALSSRAHAPAARARNLLPTTVRNAGVSGKDVYGLPVLIDHFELAYSKEIFARNGQDKPESISNIEEIARKVKTRKVWPVIAAGSRDEDLLLLVGTLMHTQLGLDSYMKLVAGIRNNTAFETLLVDSGLESVLETLLSWRRERLLHPQWLEMTNEDLEAFMRFDSTAMVFLPLSTRRLLEAKVAEKYESIYVPAEVSASSYPLTAPIYTGIRIRNELFADAPENFLYELVSEKAQVRLSRDTGLAPANSKAAVHDKQAYDVRLWAAASRVLVPDPVTAAIDDPARVASFAEEIRSYIRDGGKLLRQ